MPFSCSPAMVGANVKTSCKTQHSLLGLLNAPLHLLLKRAPKLMWSGNTTTSRIGETGLHGGPPSSISDLWATEISDDSRIPANLDRESTHELASKPSGSNCADGESVNTKEQVVGTYGCGQGARS